MEKAKWFSHGKFSEQLVRQSASNLKAIYLNAGYSQVKVTPRVTRDNGNIVVAYVVEEGIRDFVSDLQIIGNSTVPISQLAPKGLMLGSEQAVFSAARATGSQRDYRPLPAERIPDGECCFQGTRGERRSPSPGRHLHHPRRAKGHDSASGAWSDESTPAQQLITKTAHINVGAPLSEGELLSSESRLYTLGIFDWAEVDPKRAITDQNSEEVLLKVHESKRNTITYGFGFEVINRGGSVPSGTVSVPGIPPVGLPQGFQDQPEHLLWPSGNV